MEEPRRRTIFHKLCVEQQQGRMAVAGQCAKCNVATEKENYDSLYKVLAGMCRLQSLKELFTINIYIRPEKYY